MIYFLNALFPICALGVVIYAIWAIKKENENKIPDEDENDSPDA